MTHKEHTEIWINGYHLHWKSLQEWIEIFLQFVHLNLFSGVQLQYRRIHELTVSYFYSSATNNESHSALGITQKKSINFRCGFVPCYIMQMRQLIFNGFDYDLYYYCYTNKIGKIINSLTINSIQLLKKSLTHNLSLQ